MKWAKNCPFQSTKIHIYVNKNTEKINKRACYNRIWSWSPMPCEKHGPRASVTTKTSAFGLGFCLLSPLGHVFHTAWETMIKSYNTTRWADKEQYSNKYSSISDGRHINSLALGRFDHSVKVVNFKPISTLNILSIFCNIPIRWRPQHLTGH